MTVNRCAYQPCSATLRPDGPSPWFCDETCQHHWMETRKPGPQLLCVEPGNRTIVAADETPGPVSARIYREPAARLTEAAAIQVLAVTPTPELSQSGWIARALDRIRSVR